MKNESFNINKNVSNDWKDLNEFPWEFIYFRIIHTAELVGPNFPWYMKVYYKHDIENAG